MFRTMNNYEFYFNSQDLKYRSPFGALPKGSIITFFVKTLNVKSVKLKIHRDYDYTQSYEMHKVKDGFSIDFKLTQSNLYFYHFEFTTEDKEVILYGNNPDNLGGIGTLNSSNNYQITVYKYDDLAPAWYREGRAYHIFVDRFNQSDKSFDNLKDNSFIYAKTSDDPMYIRDLNNDILRWDFYAGDLWGIIDKLEYLKSLNITIIYLSPIFTARSNHRYDTQNYLEIEPMIGGETAFKALIKAASKLNIKIILDGVFNHCGADSIYFDRYNKYGGGAYHNEDSIYSKWFDIYPNKDYASWWGILDLPRINSQEPSFRKYILKAIKHWSSYGIGGWRLDVADELEDDFIREIRKTLSIDQVLIGEVWEDATNKIAYDKRRHYTNGGMLHGVMNYPFRKIIIQFLNEEISSEQFSLNFNHYLENFPLHLLYNNLNNIGSHDTKRIQNMLNFDDKLVEMAFTMMLTLPGVPCIYYGDEIGLTGDKDPLNRKFFNHVLIGNDLNQFVIKQMQFRADNPVLIYGHIEVISHNELLIIKRYNRSTHLTYVFNPTKHDLMYDNHLVKALSSQLIIS